MYYTYTGNNYAERDSRIQLVFTYVLHNIYINLKSRLRLKNYIAIVLAAKSENKIPTVY